MVCPGGSVNRDERGLKLGAKGSGSTARQLGIVLGLVFGITLAIVVGGRMSAEAMAVVVGVVCGVAASIPTSILLLLASSRGERQAKRDPAHGLTERNYPPVVVIQGGGQPGLAPGSQANYWPSALSGPSAQRDFHVVGGDELLEDGRY
jgi:hypothetical protein